jgi:hypothetical protein
MSDWIYYIDDAQAEEDLRRAHEEKLRLCHELQLKFHSIAVTEQSHGVNISYSFEYTPNLLSESFSSYRKADHKLGAALLVPPDGRIQLSLDLNSLQEIEKIRYQDVHYGPFESSLEWKKPDDLVASYVLFNEAIRKLGGFFILDIDPSNLKYGPVVYRLGENPIVATPNQNQLEQLDVTQNKWDQVHGSLSDLLDKRKWFRPASPPQNHGIAP